MGPLLHHLLEESAGRFSDRIAFTEGDREISYAQLNVASGRLAFRLRNCGIGAGDRVGVLAGRTIGAVTAVYGILKAGAAYVPLDPGAPPGRNALIQADCALKCVVDADLRLRRSFTDPGEITGELALPAADPGQPQPDETLSPDALAYILYTSGSTGTPRGVAITHRAAMYFVTWAAATVRLEPEDRIAAGSPFIFDLSVFDVFAGVGAGARAAFMSAATMLFPQNAGTFLESHKISVWYTVPSVLIRLARSGLTERNLNNLRAVLFAGEVFPVKYLRLWMRTLPDATFMNFFGPTETNVCTYYPVPAPPAADSAELPIGRPCSGTELFLLDDDGRPVPDGATGELCVRGPSVMRGYWNRPEQTAATLREIGDGGGPAYRTGDLVQLAPDGNLIFHGRRDFLIKLRGYRIEPGEVEARLDAHAAVEQSVVFTVRGPDEGDRLVAVVKVLGAVDDVELKRHCGERLPGYMIPECFERIDEWPRTATGKIDRPALRVSFDQIKTTTTPQPVRV